MTVMKTWDEQWGRLRDRLAANATDLLLKGSFTAKKVSGRKSWELRFRDKISGRNCHRSIHVGADPLKAKAEIWLSNLRQIVTWQRQMDTWARMAAWLSFRLSQRNVTFNWGQKRRRRQFTR
jgi:hypothetical protein